nr:hypothetical protein [Streptomyces sp. HNM0574]
MSVLGSVAASAAADDTPTAEQLRPVAVGAPEPPAPDAQSGPAEQNQQRPVQQPQHGPAEPSAGTGAESARATNHAHADRKVVRLWQPFRVLGKATGIKHGSTAVLQQKQHGKWVTLPIRVPVGHDGTYGMHVQLGLKGKNELRTVAGGVASPAFTVTVR